MSLSRRPGPSCYSRIFSQRHERGSTPSHRTCLLDEWTSVFGSERLDRRAASIASLTMSISWK